MGFVGRAARQTLQTVFASTEFANLDTCAKTKTSQGGRALAYFASCGACTGAEFGRNRAH